MQQLFWNERTTFHLSLLVPLVLLVGCGGSMTAANAVAKIPGDQRPATPGASAGTAEDLRFSSQIKIELTDREKERAKLIGVDCIVAMKAQDAAVEQYYEGKLAIIDAMIEHEKREGKGRNGKLAGTSTGSSCSPWSVTQSLGWTRVNGKTSRDQDTKTEGGSIAAGGGGSGSAGGFVATVPTTSKVAEGTNADTGTLVVGLTITAPLGCTNTKTVTARDDIHFIQEAMNGLYRTPIFCDMLKKCPFGLNPETLENATACGGSGFMSGPPGRPGTNPGGGRFF